MTPEEQRIKIYQGLKEYWGAIKKVVEATKAIKKGGYTRRHVDNVLTGRRTDNKVLLLAAEVLENIRAEEAQIIQRVDATLTRAEALA